MTARPHNPFGHHGASNSTGFIDWWGCGPLLLRYDGREWWFEFSDRFGPLLLRKSDKEPAVNQPCRDDHPFWPAFKAWFDAGKKIRAIRPRRTDNYSVRFWICYAPKPNAARPHKETADE